MASSFGCEPKKNSPGQVELNINMPDVDFLPKKEGPFEKSGKQLDKTIDTINDTN